VIEETKVRLVTIFTARPSNTMMSLFVSNAEVASSVEGKSEAGRQISFTIKPMPGESLSDLCNRLARQLHEREATPLQRRPTLKLDGHKQYAGLVLPRVAWTMSELRNGGGGLHFEPPHWVVGKKI